jgi:hypothetical protein
MPGTKRTRIPRAPTLGRINSHTVDLYQTALRLRKHEHRSDADREAAHDAERALNRAFNRKLWNIGILDDFMFDGKDEPSEYVQRGGFRAVDDWWYVKELREQLQAAARELTRQEREARRAKAAPLSPLPEPTV